MERWGIIGGSFDPIHLAHIYIADEAKKKLSLDKIIFMPVGSQPLKQHKRVTEASLRFKMVEKAIEGKVGFEVSDYEINKNGLSYTYETLEHFKESNRELYFITGADCLMDLEKWKSVDRILASSIFVVLTRPGFSKEKLYEQKDYLENKYNGHIIFLDIDGVDISSTKIRNKIKGGEKVDYFLNKDVYKIIKEEDLYRE